MKNYILTLFFEDFKKEISTIDLKFDGENYYLAKEFLGFDYDLILPLNRKGENWFYKGICEDENIKKKSLTENIATINYSRNIVVDYVGGDNLSHKTDGYYYLEHNDYVVVNDYVRRKVYTVLVLSVSLAQSSPTFLTLGDKLSVGRNATCNIQYNLQNTISREHFIIKRQENSVISAYVLNEKNHFYCNGQAVQDVDIVCGDILQVGALKIVYLGDAFAVYNYSAIMPSSTEEKVRFSVAKNNSKAVTKTLTRTPRIMPNYHKTELELELPPQKVENKKIPALLQIGPSLTMSMVMMVSLAVAVSNVSSGGSITSIYTSLAMAVSMLLGAILWPILSRKYQAKCALVAESERQVAYTKYLEDYDNKMSKLHKENHYILNEEMFPSPALIGQIKTNDKVQSLLYTKTIRNSDFLCCRLGYGQKKADAQIVLPKKSFSVYDDELKEKAYELQEKYIMQDKLPIYIDLKKQRINGVIGADDLALKWVKNIWMSLSFSHSYEEVKTVFIIPENQLNAFEWVYLLPHTKSDDGSISYIATNKEETHELFTSIYEEISTYGEENKNRQKNFVFFIFDNELIQNEPLTRLLLNAENDYSLATLFINSNKNKIPKECNLLIQVQDDGDDELLGQYYSNLGEVDIFNFTVDNFDNKAFSDYIAYITANKLKKDKNKGVFKELSFLDMYKVGNVKKLNITQRWSEHYAFNSLSVPIGATSNGDLFELDINERFHGPHGLAAGTTGSGKSELLQTLILSLAVNYHPDDISFVLIDYKGGGMANAFVGMPHLAGIITNLSGNMLARSLQSIEAELHNREKIFNEYKVNHIDKYQKLYRAGKANKPMPHLMIIADEFAQLKTQQPEFMQKLINVAQIGRSLGIHLLLATQKPAGLVDPQIWGNSRYKLCLKVSDKQDSLEVLHTPDAAFIKNAGRCFVQVGFSEIYQCIQTGYSGASYVPQEEYINENDTKVCLLNNSGFITNQKSLIQTGRNDSISQLDAVVCELESLADSNGIHPYLLWLPTLKTVINLNDIDEYNQLNFSNGWKSGGNLSNIVFGVADIVTEQKQVSVSLDITQGNICVIGSPRTGKTTLLQTYIYNVLQKNSPNDVQFMIFDFCGGLLKAFRNYPQVDCVYDENYTDEIFEKCNELSTIISQRRELFDEYSISNIHSYNRIAKDKLPSIIVVVDNFSYIREMNNSKLLEFIQRLARDGASVGIYLIITASAPNEITSRLRDSIKNMLSLNLIGTNTYRDCFFKSVQIEPAPEKGRGILNFNDNFVEFQTALIDGIEDDALRNKVVLDTAKIMSGGIEKSIKKTSKSNADNILTKEKSAISNGQSIAKHSKYFNKTDSKTFYKLGSSTLDKKTQGFDIENERALFISNANGSTSHLLDLYKENRYLADEFIFIDYAGVLSNMAGDIEGYYTKDNLNQAIEKFALWSKEAEEKRRHIYLLGVKSLYVPLTNEQLSVITDFIQTNKKGTLFVLEDSLSAFSNISITEFYYLLVNDNKVKGVCIANDFKKDEFFHFVSLKSDYYSKSLANNEGFLFDNGIYEHICIGGKQ